MIRAALSVYSSLTLLKGFVVEPSVEFLREFDFRAGATLERLSPIYTGHPIFGKVQRTFEIEDRHYFIVCRSAVRFGSEYSVLSPLLAEYLRWGITPASAYDTLPFSFAIDWFTGIGPSIQQFQNRILAFAAGLTSSSSSFTIRTKLESTKESVFNGEHRFYRRVNGSGLPSSGPLTYRWGSEPKWLTTPLALAISLAGL